MEEFIKIEKSFREWSRSDLRNYIGITHTENFALLNNWLNTSVEISDVEQAFLSKLMNKGKKFVDIWNETELREKFIIGITQLVDFENEKYNVFSFSERPLAVTIKKQHFISKLSGNVDWMVALGDTKPKSPFFFIHEYKKEKGVDNDPLGQLIAAMLVAQELNQDPPKPTLFNPTPRHFYKNIPIYGAYVMGRYWHFVVLQNTQYSISQPFVSTKIEDLQAIFKILKAQKQIIFSYLEK